MTNTSQQIKSKERIAKHGEVYTREKEVNAMLDLVKDECERVDSHFLEPACGNGNFLSAILKRKLNVVTRDYKKSQIYWEDNAFCAVSSIYGIDILKDNVEECRNRLLKEFTEIYKKAFKNKIKQRYIEVIKYVLSQNIIWGDALSMQEPTDTEGKQNTSQLKAKPIIIPEWAMIRNGIVMRRDYYFESYFEEKQSDKCDEKTSDMGQQVFISKPIKEYEPIKYMDINYD